MGTKKDHGKAIKSGLRDNLIQFLQQIIAGEGRGREREVVRGKEGGRKMGKGERERC